MRAAGCGFACTPQGDKESAGSRGGWAGQEHTGTQACPLSQPDTRDSHSHIRPRKTEQLENGPINALSTPPHLSPPGPIANAVSASIEDQEKTSFLPSWNGQL